MIKGIGAGYQNSNHQSWHWLLNKCKVNGETPKDEVLAAKRVINPKDGKEYCLVTYQISGYTYKGKPVNERWNEKGLHWLPVFDKAPNYEKLQMEEIPLVAYSEPVYEFRWRGDKTKITNWEWKEVLLTDLITEI